jgi:cytochrome c biogenesis protein CcmG/thiol:disulfide interchange protein DsbE
VSGRRVLVIAAAVVVLGLGGYGLVRPASHPAGPSVGEAAPPFTAPRITGGRTALTDLRGRTVLLNFWASWCIPCQQEFPVLKRAETRDAGVAVLGVVFNDSAGAAAGFMRTQQADWPSVTDPSAQIASAYGVGSKPGIPVTIIIDARGVVRLRHYGGFGNDAELDLALRQAGSLS